MKQNGVVYKIQENRLSAEVTEELFGEPYINTYYDSPLRRDAFEIHDEEKIKIISRHFREIMNVLGLDLTDDSLQGTPERVANMFVKEIFSGLDPKNKPDVTLFENKYKYKQMLVEKNINLYSTCEHHFVPIIGKAHIAYISSGRVIGLSKINRIVQYYSQRPQVQERLTIQIANELKSVLRTENVAVMIDAAHLCVSSRGVKDIDSTTVTAEYGGVFAEPTTRDEFLKHIA
jgi:GTP cyclohydrolase I